MAGSEPAAYKVKTVSFLGRRVPIMLQDVNGPCPLLAIANVLLLRNQLQLPGGVGEVSQDRLVQMVAERLLDCNSASLEGGQAGTLSTLSEEQRASLAHNLGDAIGLLPKLTTGIDVNLRHHAIDGFEYTQETAVFDLLDIPLVHGWLVDPQDEGTARAVGSKSYNELMVQLVTALGSSATPRQLTPAGSFRSSQQAGGAAVGVSSGEGLTSRTSSAGPLPAIAEDGVAAAAGTAGAAGAAGQQRGGQYIDAAALSAALHHSLHLTVPPEAAGRPGEREGGEGSEPASARSGWDASSLGPSLGETPRAPSSLQSMQTSDSMHSMVNRMLTDLVSDAFTGTPKASVSPGQAAVGAHTQGSGLEEGGEEATSALRPCVMGSGSNSNSTNDLAAAAGAGGSGAPAAAAAAAAAMAGAAGAEVAAGPGPFLGSDSGPLGSPTASADCLVCELSLEVLDEASLAAAAVGSEGPVRVRLTPRQPRQPPSPFDSLSPSSSASRGQQLAGAGAGAAASAAVRSTPATPHTSCTSLAIEGAANGGTAPAAAPAAAAPATPAAAVPGSGGSSPDEAAVHAALLVQQFLEGSPSQLTVHGLLALQEGLRPNQLAVFFRNNHFNTMFKGPGGQLYILATDEGFQYESDVVWEHLISVDGDTALVGADFCPFQMHASQEDAAARQAAAQDEDWAAAAAAAGGDSHDADLALAMQLQEEEEDRVQAEQERRRQQQARQQQQQEQQQRQQGQQQQQVLPSQRRPSSAGDGSVGAGQRRKEKKKSSAESNCCIM